MSLSDVILLSGLKLTKSQTPLHTQMPCAGKVTTNWSWPRVSFALGTLALLACVQVTRFCSSFFANLMDGPLWDLGQLVRFIWILFTIGIAVLVTKDCHILSLISETAAFHLFLKFVKVLSLVERYQIECVTGLTSQWPQQINIFPFFPRSFDCIAPYYVVALPPLHGKYTAGCLARHERAKESVSQVYIWRYSLPKPAWC